MKRSLKMWSFAVLLALCLAGNAEAVVYELPDAQPLEGVVLEDRPLELSDKDPCVLSSDEPVLFAAEWVGNAYRDQLSADSTIIYDRLERQFELGEGYQDYKFASATMFSFVYEEPCEAIELKNVNNSTLQQAYDNAIANMTQRYKKALDEVYSSFVYDHPQYFWIRAYGSTGISGDTSKISYSWNNDGTYNAVIPAYKRIIYVVSDVYRSNRESLSQQIDDTVSTILEECKRLPTVAKLAHFDSWLAKANAYNYGAANAGADYSAQHPEAWNVIGGLLDGYSPVCEGYAKSFQLLCHKIGVPCITISGGHHMWNMVKVDGNWYYVDCTWDDPTWDGPQKDRDFSTRTWFLVRDLAKGNSVHTIQMTLTTPKVASADYFSTNGLTMRNSTLSGYMDTSINALGSDRYLIALYDLNGKMISAEICVPIEWEGSYSTNSYTQARLIPPDFSAFEVERAESGKVFHLTEQWTLANNTQEATPIVKQ